MTAQDAQSLVIELRGADVAPEDAPSRIVVRGVDWRIAAGEWWSVGASPGAGKSSLLATAAGLAPPARGSVCIFGRDPTQLGDAEKALQRRYIGFVFEHGGRLLHRLSVAENVALPVRYHENLGPAEGRERVRGLLERLGLLPYAELLPSRVPAALRGRVALARALAEPLRVLFLDNPFAALPPGGVRWWLRLLAELREQHLQRGQPLTLVASGYGLAPWSGLADRFAVLRDQRFEVLERGAPLEPYDDTELESTAGSPR